MTKTHAVAALLSLAVISFNANLQDNGRIDQLEKEIQELKLRLSKLETSTEVLRNLNTSTFRAMYGSPLRAGESYRPIWLMSDVRGILGEPYRVDGGSVASWDYKNGDTVTFRSSQIVASHYALKAVQI